MKNKEILLVMAILGLAILPVASVHLGSVYAQEGIEEGVKEEEPLEFDNTEWEVNMVYVTEKGKKESSVDKLIFKDRKFISESFEKKGYDPTNYSLILEEDGTTKFGTMQIKDKETSFWKGVVHEGAIDGSVHTQIPKGSPKTVYFTGKLITGTLLQISKAKAARDAEEAAAAAAAAVEQQASEAAAAENIQPIEAQPEDAVAPPPATETVNEAVGGDAQLE